MKTAIINLIFQGWPETVALLFTSLTILGAKVRIKRIIFYALILSSIIWLIRLLPVYFGIHTLVALLGTIIVIYKEAKVTIGTSFYIGVLTGFLLIVSEMLVHIIFKSLFGDVSVTDTWLWVLIGWPQIIIVTVSGYILGKYIRPMVLMKNKKRNVLNE